MTTPHPYVSYLIRLWHIENPTPVSPTDNWQGEVTHIQSGTKRKFDDFEELITLLRAGPYLPVDKPHDLVENDPTRKTPGVEGVEDTAT